MRLVVALTVWASLALFASAALAEEASGDEVVPIEHGERAPFSGQLFPTELAIRMGMRIERLELQLEADVQRAQDLCAAETAYRDRLLELERERYQNDTTELRTAAEGLADELAEARQVPWWRSWGFAFGMGVLASVLLVAGTAALAVSL